MATRLPSWPWDDREDQAAWWTSDGSTYVTNGCMALRVQHHPSLKREPWGRHCSVNSILASRYVEARGAHAKRGPVQTTKALDGDHVAVVRLGRSAFDARFIIYIEQHYPGSSWLVEPVGQLGVPVPAGARAEALDIARAVRNGIVEAVLMPIWEGP